MPYIYTTIINKYKKSQIKSVKSFYCSSCHNVIETYNLESNTVKVVFISSVKC